jgi:Ca-activated chloride channel family protein
MTEVHTAVSPKTRLDVFGGVFKGLAMKGRLDGMLLTMEAEQRFVNEERKVIEAVYSFPLPSEATLLELSVKIGERELVARVTEKNKAELVYEQAIEAGDGAILLNSHGSGIYSVNVGNLKPGEEVVLCYKWAQLLAQRQGQIRVHLPTVIAPRYGRPGRFGFMQHEVPDSNVLSSYPLSLDLLVCGQLAGAEVKCPQYSLDHRQEEEGRVYTLGAGATLDRDLVLNFRPGEAEMPEATAAPDLEGLTVLASFNPLFNNAENPSPRLIKLLVDGSGSMGGVSIQQARIGLKAILESLRSQDRFSLHVFGSGCHNLMSRDTSGKEDMEAALRKIGQLDANYGGTELEAALKKVLSIHDPGCKQEDLLLITDGEVWAEDLVQRVQQAGQRVFVVGVGCSPAEGLLTSLATSTGGAIEFVTPGEDMAARIFTHYQRMNQPRAAGMRVEWPGEVLEEDLPAVIYSGDSVLAMARLADLKGDAVALVLDGEGTERWRGSIKLISCKEESPSVASRIRVDQLIKRSGSSRSEEELKQLALNYQLASPYTAHVVVDPRSESDKSSGMPELRKVPQMMAAGWHGMGAVACHAEMANVARDSVESLASHFNRSKSSKNKVCRDAPRPMPSELLSTMKKGVEQLFGHWLLAELTTLEGLAKYSQLSELHRQLSALDDGALDMESCCLIALYLWYKAGRKLPLSRADRIRLVKQAEALRDSELWNRVSEACDFTVD